MQMGKLTKVFGLIKKINLISKSGGRHQEDKSVYRLINFVTDGLGKPPYIPFEGENLSALPEFLRPLYLGLKKPRVEIGMKSKAKGQGIFGIKISDGGSPVSVAALGIDMTRGKSPIIQLKGQFLKDGKRVSGLNVLLNPNITLNPETCGKTTQTLQGGSFLSSIYTNEHGQMALSIQSFVDKKSGMSKLFSKEFLRNLKRLQNLKPKTINEQFAECGKFFGNKGISILKLNECMDDILKIAQMKGKPSLKSVQNAAQTLLKQMGYNPTLLSLSKKSASGGAMSFNQLTGEIAIDPEFLKRATYQDIAVILSHELTHMEDFIRFYKAVGPAKFEALVRPAELLEEGVPELNHKWYQQMSEHVDPNDWKWMTGLQKTVTKDKSGKVIETINHQAFNAQSIIKEFEAKIKYYKEKNTGVYDAIKREEMYQISSIEEHARLMETNILRALEDKGLLKKTKFSDMYAKGPFDYLGRYKSEFSPIEKLLKKFKSKKSEKFDELFYQQIEARSKELADLRRKLDQESGLPAEEFKRMEELIKQHYGSVESMNAALMHEIKYQLEQIG